MGKALINQRESGEGTGLTPINFNPAARKLNWRQKELQKAHAEPLLPVEKRLFGWSLGIGITLLVILALFNHLFPAGA